MSSVNSNSSGTSGLDERVRKARDDYRKKEAELIKRQNKEIKELSDRYVTQSDQKDIAHSQNLNVVREKSQEALTNKDMRYQKEMDDLKSMHTKQLEKLMLENRAKTDATSKAAKLEIKQARTGKADRVDELSEQYGTKTAEQEQKFSESLEQLREDQQEDIGRAREKLNTVHEKETSALREERDDSILKLKNEYRRLRENTDQRLKGQEVRHLQDKLRSDSSHMDTLKEESIAHNRQQAISREGFEDGIHEVRREMAQAREKDLEANSAITGAFQSSVKDRVEGKVNRLENDLIKEKQKAVTNQADAVRGAHQQIRNMSDAYQNKFDYLEKARVETLRQSNEINAQNIRKVTSGVDKQMAENSRYYISRNEIDNLRNHEYIDGLEKDHKLVEDYNRVNTEGRIDRIRQDSDVAQSTLRDAYMTNLETLKGGNEEEKKDLVLGHLKEKNQTESQYKTLLQKQEITHQRQEEDTVAKYEKRIASLNDQFVREKRLRDNKEKTLFNEMKRKHDDELEALRMKYEDQNKQTTVAHERELKESQRRNQGKIDEVINSIKKS